MEDLRGEGISVLTNQHNLSFDFFFTGKTWHDRKRPFRLNSGQTSYAERQARRKDLDVAKALEKDMKEEKSTKREVRIEISVLFLYSPRSPSLTTTSVLLIQTWIQGIKDRREAKVERERYELLAQKMHKKRVERLKRREKRNKLLNS